MNRKDSKVVQDYWVVFPYKGIRLVEAQDCLSRPIGERLTLVGKEYLASAIDHLHKNEALYEVFSNMLSFQTEFDSVLAVRGKTDDVDQDFYRSMYLVAREQSAIFTVNQLLSNDYHVFTNTILDNTPSTLLRGATITTAGKLYSVCPKVDHWPRFIVGPHYEISFEDLRAQLFSPITAFGQYVLSSSDALAESRDLLTSATFRIASSVLSLDVSNQLLFAVTALETLFGAKHKKYQTLTERLFKVLDWHILWNKIQLVFDARHAYVHEGRLTHDETLAAEAQHLALAALIVYSRLLSQFGSRHAMLAAIDSWDNDEAQRTNAVDLSDVPYFKVFY